MVEGFSLGLGPVLTGLERVEGRGGRRALWGFPWGVGVGTWHVEGRAGASVDIQMGWLEEYPNERMGASRGAAYMRCGEAGEQS